MREGTESDERKEWSQIVVPTVSVHLYLNDGWENVCEDNGITTLRKWIAPSKNA